MFLPAPCSQPAAWPATSGARLVTPASRGVSRASPQAPGQQGLARLRCRSVAELTSPQEALLGVRSETEFMGVLKAAAEKGLVPKALVPGFQDFYANYRTAVVGSGVPGSDEAKVAQVMASIADRVLVQFRDPFTFPSKHDRMLEPYNYYQFGQNYVRLLIDFRHSLLGEPARFQALAQQLAAGENVVLLANHQTEADPAVWALLLEHLEPGLATDVRYVAGDRVVTDPLCKPFSMGRNLFCVHSRKRMDDVPELKEEKQRTNRRTLGAMVKALRQGGQLLWVAPSGGRDRPSPEGEWRPAAFDPAVVGTMAGLLASAKRPGHMYPLAMHSADIMPPPPAAEVVLGERRLTTYAPVGMVLGEELAVPARAASEDEQRGAEAELSQTAFEAVTRLYASLRDAMREHAEGGAATGAFVQPWLG